MQTATQITTHAALTPERATARPINWPVTVTVLHRFHLPGSVPPSR